MLIQIAFFILMLLGVAALTVDMGYVRLTRSQMQNAADTAALEGLRQLDTMTPNCDATGNEQNRRCAASRMAAWTFDANFDLTDNDADPAQTDPRQIGAGPAIDMTDQGQGDFGGLPQFNVQNSGVYKPGRPDTHLLETNFPGNARYGDMVSGTYNTPDSDCPPTSGSEHTEDNQYCRTDFAAVGTRSFLVRLRRTNDFKSLDRVDGISSSGPTLPLMFARGMFVCKDCDPNNPQPNPNNYNPRLDGITVRATAIADAKPALRVGQSNSPGAVPFAILPGSTTFCNTTLPSGPVTVGLEILVSFCDPSVIPSDGYVLIYDSINGTNRVVGFGLVQNGALRPSSIAPSNATALISGGFPVSGADLKAVLDANRSLAGALLVPVIAR